MPLTPVTPKETPTWSAMLFDGTAASVAELEPVVDAAVVSGYLIRRATETFREGEIVERRIRMQTADGAPEMLATIGTWVAVASTGAIRVLSDADYHAEFDED